MKTLLLLLVISIGSNETSAKSIGQMLDDTINYLTSRMTNTKETKKCILVPRHANIILKFAIVQHSNQNKIVWSSKSLVKQSAVHID